MMGRVIDARVPRYAELLLDTCLGVAPGWKVMMWGTPWARPLLEEAMPNRRRIE